MKNKLINFPLIFGLIFVIAGLYVLDNRGDLPEIFTNEYVNEEGMLSGELTFFGGILYVITLPVAFLGLTVDFFFPETVFILFVVFLQGIYGALFGQGIRKILDLVSSQR